MWAARSAPGRGPPAALISGDGLPLLKKWLLLCGSILFALLIGEVGLRLRYPGLPSLSPLEESPMEVKYFQWSDYPPMKEDRDLSLSCREQSYVVEPGSVREMSFGEGEGPPLKLWVAGDSVTMGYGVPRGTEFGSLLAGRLAKLTGGQVVLRNLGINGAGFCAVLRRLNENVRSDGAPDVVVLTLFADDLEDRAMVAVKSRLVAFPDRVDSTPIRLLVSNSYVANLIWYGISAQQEKQRTTRRYIDDKGQALFKDSVTYMRDRLKEQGTVLVTVLLSPAGLHFCADEPVPGSRCAWLGPDMDLIARLLKESEIPFVDLRHVWEDKPTMIIHEELGRMRRGLELGVHPDEKGHQVLADEMWPAVEEGLLKRSLAE